MKLPNRRPQFVPATKIVSFESGVLFFLFGFAKKATHLQNFSNFEKYSYSKPGQKICSLTLSWPKTWKHSLCQNTDYF